MALPTNVGVGTVVWSALDGAGTTMQGSVTFTPSPARLLDTAASPSPVTIFPKPVTVTLSGGSLPATTLIATDDTDLNPVGWTWTVSFALTGVTATPYSFALPQGTTVDLTTVAPLPSANGTFYTQGVKGDPGTPGVLPITDAGSTPGTARPATAGVTAGVVIWLVNYGVTPTNALSTDVILERGDTGADSAALNPAVEAGFLGWSMDPRVLPSSSVTGSGNVITARVKARKSGTVASLDVFVGTAGVSLTYAKMAIFDIAGNQLGITADMSTALTTTTGEKVTALVSGVTVTIGTEYILAILQVGTTTAAIARGYSGGAGNIGYSNPVAFGQIPSQAAMPATVNPTTLGTSSIAFWVGMK